MYHTDAGGARTESVGEPDSGRSVADVDFLGPIDPAGAEGEGTLMRDFFHTPDALAALHPIDHAEIPESSPHPIPDAVMRAAEFPRGMGDLDFADAESLHEGQGGKKTVHAVEERESGDDFGAKDFQGATAVMDTVLKDPAAEGIGELGGVTAGKEVLSILTPAAHHVAVGQEGEEFGDFRGRVLSVGIEGNEDFALRGAESGVEGGGLAVVAGQSKVDQLRNFFLQGAEDQRGLIGGTIVHDDDFETAGELSEDGMKFVEQGGEIFRLVVGGDHDGIFQRSTATRRLVSLSRCCRDIHATRPSLMRTHWIV